MHSLVRVERQKEKAIRHLYLYVYINICGFVVRDSIITLSLALSCNDNRKRKYIKRLRIDGDMCTQVKRKCFGFGDDEIFGFCLFFFKNKVFFKIEKKSKEI